MTKMDKSQILRIVLIVAAVILLVLIFVFSLKNNTASKLVKDADTAENAEKVLDEASEIEDEGEHALYVPKDEIYTFSITDGNGIVLGFEKDDEKWIYSDDPSLNLNQERIDKVLNFLSDVRFINSIDTDKPEEYGLSQDSKMYVVSDSSGSSTIISIGNVDEETGNVYFAINYDFDTVYVNSGKLLGVTKYTVQQLVTH